MPQIFQVLRCYKCLVFQTHQTKKSNRWECKLCGEKQSVKRHYGLGTGKDCRLQVQKLNALRGEKDENKINENSTNEDSEIENVEDTINNSTRPLNINKSKWSDYVETHEEPHEPESVETMYLGEEEVVLEIPKKRKKKHNKISDVSIERSNSIKDNLKSSQFNIPLKSITQKIDNKISDESCIISIVKPIVLKKENSKSQVIPPATNRNSKWAQYTDDQASQKKTLLPPTEVTRRNTQKGMFSLCEEGDLDHVLDI